jgi:signal transduction histidine kinase
MTVERKKPNVYCHTCGQHLSLPNLDLDELLVTTPEEAKLACAEGCPCYKTLRCENPFCVAPTRAIVMPRAAEPSVVPHLKSWVPVATFRLSFRDDRLSPIEDYSAAIFSVDKTRRTPDLNFGESMDIDLLRRSLDGFGRENKGIMTVFDYFCWQKQDLSHDKMIIPIETFHSSGMVPQRFNPFCATVRRQIHAVVVAEVNSRLSRGPCEFLKSADPATPAYPKRKPFCSKCLIKASGAAQDVSASESVPWHKCWLYFQVCRDFSPCYQSDFKHFNDLLSEIATHDFRSVVHQWQSQPEKHCAQCWAGFWELLVPIVMHNHLVAFAMGGQALRVPNPVRAHAPAGLASIKNSALAAAAKVPCLSSPSVLKDLERSFNFDSWMDAESKQQCKWILDDNALHEKAVTLASNAILIQKDVSERYSKKRRIQEDCFHDELCARLDLGIQEQPAQPILALPQIIQRMCDFWAFKDVLYLSNSGESKNSYAFMVDSEDISSLADQKVVIPIIEFSSGQVPPLGIMITSKGPNLQERTPGCQWTATIRALEQHCHWPQLDDLVLFVMPTNFGQDLFVFHSRDPNEVSFKPHLAGPSDACTESIRRTCGSLAKRLSVAAEKQHLEERLRIAKEQIEESSRGVVERVLSLTASEMATLIRHDIKTALQTLLSPLGLLASYSVIQRQPKALDEIEKAKKEISDLANRLDHLAKYYSIAGGESELGEFEPDVLVNRAVGFCSARCKRAGIMVLKDYEKPLPYVVCFEIETVEIVYNLLTNAIKAMRETTSKNLSIAIKVGGEDRVRIEVADTGSGMTREEREQLFYLVRSKSGGSGIGLFTCRNIAEKMDAYVACKETAVGRGSTFVLDLKAVSKRKR